MRKKQRAARYYVQQEIKGLIDDDINTGDLEEAFIAGVDWQYKKAIEAHRKACPHWNNCKDRVSHADCQVECEYQRLFIRELINN